LIPHDFITEWRQYASWTEDSQIEQDLVICRALVEIFSLDAAAGTLAFRGGTALHKLHLPPAARYSEDIDLVQMVAGPIGPVLDAMRGVLDPWLGEPKRVFKEGRVSLSYRMVSEGPPPVPIRLKLEINSREHFTVFGLEEHSFAVNSRWYSGAARIKTFQRDELLGTKLRALYQRKKGRDLFDLWAAQADGKVEASRVVHCFLQYLDHSGLRVSRAEFEANFARKLADPAFTQDVEPLLGPRVEWDIGEAARYLQEELFAHLPGSPWKGADSEP
jgi:predicted nucleotidyltransferase component of viral defense system